MSLFGMLGSTARALDAQRFGLDVVGNNLANVNTAGYTKRVLDMGAVPPSDRFSAGNGVEVLGVRSMRDRLYDQRLFDELPLEQQQAAIRDSLGLAEVALGQPGSSIDGALADFFDAFAELADAPSSTTARQQVVSEAQALAGEFSSMASRLDDAARATDAQVRSDVEQINALASQIAALNKSIGSSPATETLHLRDEQVEAIKALSGLLGMQVQPLSDGPVRVTTCTVRPLVIGEKAYPLGISSAPTTGFARITSNGVDITSEITDGHLGGLTEVRDSKIPGYVAAVDQLAYSVATQVNAVHATGFDLAGNAGGPLFAAPAAVAGAAAGLQVSAAVAADPSRVAAAGIASPGDNQIARQLANLRDGAIVDGATPGAAWATLVYRVGADVNTAANEQRSRGEIVNQIELLRDSVSGISIDEEAASMMRFQRAYEANARFFTVIDETLQTLLSLKR